MANYKKWTDPEIQFIKENALTMDDKSLSVKLSQMTGENIGLAMIRRQRRKLNIVKSRGRPAKVKDVSLNETID
jgi:hypothetical protein